MLESHLVFDSELKTYDDTLMYFHTTTGCCVEAPFIRTEFLEQIQEKQKVLKK